MSEMPARIWVERSFAWVADKKQNDGVAFVRADIAERMAEALEYVLQADFKFGANRKIAKNEARKALSAWKDGR